MIMLTLTGIAAPALVNSALAAVGSYLGHACAASEENGLAALIGPQAGVNWPRNTTVLMASRSRLSSNARRTRASADMGPASGEARMPGGLPTPATLARLMV